MARRPATELRQDVSTAQLAAFQFSPAHPRMKDPQAKEGFGAKPI
jgi:hypothetical protein